MAIFIDDLFHLFWIHAVMGDVLEIVFVPLRTEDSKLHDKRLSH